MTCMVEPIEIGKPDTLACQSLLKEQSEVTGYACMCQERGVQNGRR